MSTPMGGGEIIDCSKPEWSLEVAVSSGRVLISAFGNRSRTGDGKRSGGKVFLDQAGARELMEQLQEAHAYNNWQPYPELYF